MHSLPWEGNTFHTSSLNVCELLGQNRGIRVQKKATQTAPQKKKKSVYIQITQ